MLCKGLTEIIEMVTRDSGGRTGPRIGRRSCSVSTLELCSLALAFKVSFTPKHLTLFCRIALTSKINYKKLNSTEIILLWNFAGFARFVFFEYLLVIIFLILFTGRFDVFLFEDPWVR